MGPLRAPIKLGLNHPGAQNSQKDWGCGGKASDFDGGAPEFRFPFFGPDSLRFALASFRAPQGYSGLRNVIRAGQDSAPGPGIRESPTSPDSREIDYSRNCLQ